MSLQSIYQRYLVAPSADVLAEDANVNYIPTLSSIVGQAGILKHRKAQDQLLTKKSETILGVVESQNGLCLETETTMQFIHGGGTYLPGIDDNLLADRIVTFPIVHVVSFNANQRIQSIRVFWDQASLLKAVDVIGSRGRAWPVKDGKDQARLIASCGSTPTSQGSTGTEERAGRVSSRLGGGSNADPHSSLKLFAPREIHEREESRANAVAPRESAKPPPRDYGELFVDGEEATDAPSGRERSPSKENANPLKSGAGKHYGEIRLFDGQHIETSPEKGIKTDPKKYQHFEFGEAPLQTNSPVKTTKHQSQWDFSDFTTPQKVPSRRYNHTIRNSLWGDLEADPAKPDVHLEHKLHARPDAAPHFEFDDTPKAAIDARPMSRDSHGLYEDHILGSPDAAAQKMPLGNITNVKGHQKTFSSQFEIQDASPAGASVKDAVKDENQSKAAPTTKNSTQKTLTPSWSLFDDSAVEEKPRGIKISGNGMGNRTGSEMWEF